MPVAVLTTIAPVDTTGEERIPSHVPLWVDIMRRSVGISTVTVLSILRRMICPLAVDPENIIPLAVDPLR
jgi:hypothetical protein